MSTSSFCLDSDKVDFISDTANNSETRSQTILSIDSIGADDSSVLRLNFDSQRNQNTGIVNNIRKVNEMTNGLIDFLQRTFQFPANSDFNTIKSSIKKCVKLMVERKRELKSLKKENRELSAIISANNSDFTSTPKGGSLDNVYQERIRDLERLLNSARKANESLNIEINNKADIIKNLQKNQAILESKLQNTLAKTDSKAESTDAQIYIISQELHNEQTRSKQLEEELAERKEKGKALKSKVNQLLTEIKEKDAKFEQFKIQYDKMFLEHDDLISETKNSSTIQQLKAELNSKNSEIETLNKALTELTNQLGEINEDLHAENNSRNKAVSVIQKLSYYIPQFESYVRATNSEKNSLLAQLHAVTKEKDELTQKLNSFLNTLDEIPSVLSELLVEKLRGEENLVDSMYEILNDKTVQIQKRLTMVINTLLEHSQFRSNSAYRSRPMLKDISDLQKQNFRLLTYIHNLSHFIDRVASSGDVQDWLIDSNDTDIKNKLSSQSLKIQSFMQSNNLLIDQTPLAEAFIYFPKFCQEHINSKIFEHDEFAKEAFVLLEQYALANTILSTYSSQLQNHGQLLVNEVKQMRQTIESLQREAENANLDATVKIEAQLEVERDSKKQLQATIDKIHQVLINSIDQEGDNNSAIFRCVGIINGNENSILDDSSSLDVSLLNEYQFQTPQEYIKVLENKCVALNDKVKLTEDALKQEMIEKEKAIKDLNDQLKLSKIDYEDYINNNTLEMEKLTSEISSLKQSLKSTRDENRKLSSEYNESQNAILKLSTEVFEMEQKYKNELELIVKENNEQLKSEREEHKNKIADKQAKIDELCSFHENEINRMKNSHKTKVERLTKDLKIQTERNDKIKEHFETMLAELRSKLQESRLSETSAVSKTENLTIENNELRSKIASLSIDFKVLKMKLQSAEEKAKRDRGLDNTKANMKLLSLETENQAAIDKIKNQCNDRMHNFLISVCNKFRDYVDFNKAISEESVTEFLDNVYNTMNKIIDDNNKLIKLNSELDEVRKTLDIDTNESVSKIVDELYQKVQHYDKLRDQIEKDSSEASSLAKQTRLAYNASFELKAWEDWAKRLNSLITDNFTITKSNNQLRFILEEALMSTVGKLTQWRRLEILRMEKAILVSGIYKVGNKNGNKNINLSVIYKVFDAIHKMQKLSGHLKCSICISSKYDDRSYSSTSPDSRKLPLLPII